MRSPGSRPIGRNSLEEHRLAAENRYQRYVRETDGLLTDAARARDQGKWSDVAACLQAAAATMSAAQGCARELNLLYLLNGA
jgi:hypothetical protein